MDNDADLNFVLGDFAKLINNSGSIINGRNLVSAGRMNNLCGGTVTGPVNGNQPVTVCSIN